MTVAKRLESLRKAALGTVDTIGDETLQSGRLETLARQLAEGRFLEPPRVRRAMVGLPRATRIGMPGDPGAERPGGQLVTVPGTRVDMLVAVDGVATLMLFAEENDRPDLAGGEIDEAGQQIVLAYVAEYPSAQMANAFFVESLDAIDRQIGELRERVCAFNEELEPALLQALHSAKSRADERAHFAADLRQPRLPRSWWESQEQTATDAPA